MAATLHEAILANNIDLVNDLIAQGVNINQRGQSGRTPLYLAATSNNLPILNALIAAGADVNMRVGQTTVLHHSLRYPAIVQALIDAGVNLENKDFKGETVLCRASSLGFEPAVNLLIKADANLDARNKHGRTPLAEAVINGHTNIVNMLIEAGADVSVVNKGQTLLGLVNRRRNGAEISEILQQAMEYQNLIKEPDTYDSDY